MMKSSACEIVRTELDRRAMRRARARAAPSLSGARQRGRVGEVFGGHHALQCGEPMVIISLAGIGIAGGLRLLDLIAQHGGPFRPGEEAPFLERQSEREGFGFPGRSEYRAFGIAGDAGHGLRRALRGRCGAHAGSRYGSNASIEIVSAGSAFSPHNSRPANRTV